MSRFTLIQALVLGGAAVLAWTAVSSRRPEATPPAPAGREVRPRSPAPKPPTPELARIAERLPEPPVPPPAPAVAAPENPQALAGWLLALPDADLAKLAGTQALDQWVARVADHLVAGAGEQELVEFLHRLNVRIEGARF